MGLYLLHVPGQPRSQLLPAVVAMTNSSVLPWLETCMQGQGSPCSSIDRSCRSSCITGMPLAAGRSHIAAIAGDGIYATRTTAGSDLGIAMDRAGLAFIQHLPGEPVMAGVHCPVFGILPAALPGTSPCVCARRRTSAVRCVCAMHGSGPAEE